MNSLPSYISCRHRRNYGIEPEDHIHHKAIELDKISLKGISTNGYALYQAARTIMTGKSYIQITELADDSLISAYAFKAIINAFMIAKNMVMKL